MRDSESGGLSAADKQAEKVAKAASQGASRDYSNLREVMANKEAYDAFKAARLARVKEERISSQKPKVTAGTQYAQPSTVSRGQDDQPEYYNPPQPTPSTPAVTAAVATSTPVVQVKTAPIDTILFNEDSAPIEFMTDLIFENIGGQELINIARNDTINGQSISYQPIQNLTDIQKQYNPNNIISLQQTSEKYFDNFSIKLDTKIPNVGNGPNGDNVYLDSATGNITIDLINLAVDEQVELEILIDGTIYKADI